MAQPKYMLEDAQAIHREHPATFDVPDPITLAAIRPGTHVKLCFTPAGAVLTESHWSERMWVMVTERDGNRLVGRVDNHPALFESDVLDIKSVVEFTTDNIYAVGPT